MLRNSIARFSFAVLAGACLTTACSAQRPAASPTSRVQITELTNRVRVEINGQLFTEYHFRDVPRPFCYPLIGPGGAEMMRHWPMKEAPDEARDHPHHRSLWFTHGDVNGHDFWSEARSFGKVVHAGFDQIESGADVGVIKSRNNWVAADGKIICTDQRTLRVYNRPANERLMDFDVTIHASHGEVTFGDTKEGSMAVRLAESMRLKPNPANVGKPTGRIVNSEGVRDQDTWGKRAAWCDYYGPVDGRIVGLAIFDHPQNPRHPTWWHVRDYGLFAANPFGRHDFEKLEDKTAGNLVIPAGKSVTFRYRFYFHEGDEKQADVAKRYREYITAR